MQTIDNFNFAGKKAFVRVDFNVPLDENFNITDDTRMRAALPTLKKILADGGSVIIGSHLGRPKGATDKFSLKHILKHLSELLGVDVQFANDCIGEEAGAKAAALQPGEALLLENLRFYAEEEGKPRGLAEDASDEEKKAAKKAVKESQKEFTKRLASYADCYVNDAFGTAHRAHASTALIADYFDTDNKMFGYLMEKEVKAVDKVMNDIQRPFTAIMGGSKVSSKIGVASSLAAALSVVSALLPHPASAAVPRTAAAVRIPAFLTVWNDFFIIVLSFPSRRSSCSCLQTCTVPLGCGFQSNIEPAANQLRFL